MLDTVFLQLPQDSLSHILCVNFWFPKVNKTDCFPNFLNLTLVVVFYRSTSFVSDILLELKQLNPTVRNLALLL